MAKSTAPIPLPNVPTPEPVAEGTQRLYGLERDVATGCWVESYHDVPKSVVAATRVRDGDARHIPGVLMEIERDARQRVG